MDKKKTQLSYCLVFCRLFHENCRLFDTFNVTRTNDSLIVIFLIIKNNDFLLSILLKAKTTAFKKIQITVQHWKLQYIEMAQYWSLFVRALNLRNLPKNFHVNLEATFER